MRNWPILVHLTLCAPLERLIFHAPDFVAFVANLGLLEGMGAA